MADIDEIRDKEIEKELEDLKKKSKSKKNGGKK